MPATLSLGAIKDELKMPKRKRERRYADRKLYRNHRNFRILLIIFNYLCIALLKPILKAL